MIKKITCTHITAGLKCTPCRHNNRNCCFLCEELIPCYDSDTLECDCYEMTKLDRFLIAAGKLKFKIKQRDKLKFQFKQEAK